MPSPLKRPSTFLAILFFLPIFHAPISLGATLMIEAEQFQFTGAWEVEHQAQASAGLMLRDAGRGLDAMTVIDIKQPGAYSLWTRSKDFATDRPKTRRYILLIDNKPADNESGQHGRDGWYWELVGKRDLPAGQHVLALHDTTHSFGRCDAVLLTTAALDPNAQKIAALASHHAAPVQVQYQVHRDEKDPNGLPRDYKLPTPGDDRREVARIANERVAITFIGCTDKNTGQPLVLRRTERLSAGKPTLLADAGPAEALYLIHTPDSAANTTTLFASWRETATEARFELNGQTYRTNVSGDKNNPYRAGVVEPLIPVNAKPIDASTVEVTYRTPAGLTATGRWALPPDRLDALFSVNMTVPRDGDYSLAFSPFDPTDPDKLSALLLSPLFQFQRVPPEPVMLISSITPHPLVLVQRPSPDGQRQVTLAISADPTKLPFQWATGPNARYGFSLHGPLSAVQPTAFAPVLGLDGSKLKQNQTLSASWHVWAQDGDWKQAIEYSSEKIFNVRDYRRQTACSLTHAAINMIDLIKNADAAGWSDRLKGFWNIEAKSTASQSSPLMMVSAAILSHDEDFWRTRALPSIEYTLSRPGAHFAVDSNPDNSSYIRESSTRITVPSAFYGTSYWQGLDALLGHANPWVNEFATDRGQPIHRTGYSAVPLWSEMLALYRLSPSPDALKQVQAECDRWIASEIYARKTKVINKVSFYNVSFYPYWWDLMDLYDLTHDRKYVAAAEESAFFTIAGLWVHPAIPAGTYTEHPNHRVGVEEHSWWKDDHRYRLGAPIKPEDLPEKSVPAWTVSQVGLGLEQPTTYWAAGREARNIMMSCWAPHLLRLYEATGRDIYRTFARNTIIERFGNYPGYYIRGLTDLPHYPDYPLKGPDITSIYYHHIPVHLAFTVDFLLAEAQQRSAGKIRFPWTKQQGYVWFANRIYGVGPGQVMDDNAVELGFYPKQVRVADERINYLVGRGKTGQLWLILMNESDQPLDVPVSLDVKSLGLKRDPAPPSAAWAGDTLTVRVEPMGLRAVAVPGVPAPAPQLPPLKNGHERRTLPAGWGEAHTFRIRSPFGKDAIYVVLTGRPQNGVARLQLDNQPMQECRDYPYEFSIYPCPMDRDMNITLKLTQPNHPDASETITLPSAGN